MPRLSRTILAALALALFVAHAPAHAQPERSPNELRVENDMLKERIAELEGQLEQARRRIDLLERTIARMRERSGGEDARPADKDATDEPDGRPVAEIPENPFASPASMLAHLKKEYEKAMQGKAYDDARDKQAYIRDLRGWSRSAAQQASGQVEWVVRVLSHEQVRPGTTEFRLEVVDTASGLAIGEAFAASLSGRHGARLQEATPDELWVLDAVLRTEIAVNADRETPDTEGPSLIGPFAEFSFNLVARAVRPQSG